MTQRSDLVFIYVQYDESWPPGHRDTYGSECRPHFQTLRYALALTGSKQGCDKGDCGACTVILDGAPTLACLTPVWEAEGSDVTTVEGLAGPEGPHPLQDEFDLNGAAQCGFCTPGILCSAAVLLDKTSSPTRLEIQEALSGNLCRCTGYAKIYDAIEAAAIRIKERKEGGA